MQISKSEYLMFLKHPAWLWYKKHDKDKLPGIDANLQAKFDAGAAFEHYAEQRFPNGIRLGFGDYQQYLSLPGRTKKALDDETRVLFQGRFEAEDLTCICDVIASADKDTVDLYEIKSSTRVKQEHEQDLAFQLAVLEAAGYEVRTISIIHVDRDYIRDGDIDPLRLTKVVDITEKVKSRRRETKANIAAARKIIKSKTPPDISPRHAAHSGYSEWLEIYKQLVGGVEDDSIYNLFWPGPEIIGQLEDARIARITDIPESFPLRKKQQARQVKAARAGTSQIKVKKIKDFMAHLDYPLYFLDYETMNETVPPFDGLRPYEQLPFQYSLHVLESAESDLKHYEYLHTDPTNPAPQLIERLSGQIGDSGTVLVWWSAFETACNQLLARLHPEGKELMTNVNERIKDLMLPFLYGWYVDAAFFGSASIKNVLPVLVPELSYKNLEIQEGNSAQRLWVKSVLKNKTPTDLKKLFDDLRQYCRMDTLAMVEIFRRLSQLPDNQETEREQLQFF